MLLILSTLFILKWMHLSNSPMLFIRILSFPQRDNETMLGLPLTPGYGRRQLSLYINMDGYIDTVHILKGVNPPNSLSLYILKWMDISIPPVS